MIFQLNHIIYQETKELHQIDEVLSVLMPLLKKTPLLLLVGDLGSGKTTLVKQIFKKLGEETLVNSPTFNIVNTYTLNNQNIHHFDLYRIKNEAELMEFGFWEYLDSDDMCIIEWPEIIINQIDHPFVLLKIEHVDALKRHYILSTSV